jgi:RNA polymerase sigma factor (sigma-70 family)
MHQNLIDGCIRGEKSAQFQLYKQYSKAMFNICYRITNNHSDAEDALQEAFINAFKYINEFEGRSSIGAWLKKIVVNQALNFMHKKKLEFTTLNDQHHLIEVDETEEYNYVLEIGRIRNAVQQLPDGYRIVFSLYLLEGYDHGEIAEILKISESTSKSQYNRAKKKLKEILKEEVYHER